MSSEAVQILKTIIDNVEKVIIGKRSSIELTILSLACEGHILIEDVPGVGKTSLAAAVCLSFLLFRSSTLCLFTKYLHICRR